MTVQPGDGVDVVHDSPPTAAPRGDEWAVLGLLRFFLALCVACFHYQYVFDSNANYLPRPILFFGSFNGISCVYCFFLISGYSIAASVERDAKGFLERRAWRIYPVYWTCLALSYIPYAVAGHGFDVLVPPRIGVPSPLAVFVNLTGMPCFVTPAIASIQPCWSLACEIAYYLVAPLLTRRSWLPVALFVASLLAFRAFGIQHWAYVNILPTVELAWIWLAGYLYRVHREHRNASVVFLGIVLLLIGNDSIYALTAILLITARYIRLPDRLPAMADYVGELSYPLYLCHYPVYFTLFVLAKDALIPVPGVYLIAALTVAIVILHCVDLPCRKRYRRHRSPG